MSRSHLICYAAGAPVHDRNRERLVASARRYGIDTVRACGPEDIDARFCAQHRELFSEVDGAGYWLWKPYLILQSLERAGEGDIVLYIDSGAYLRKPPHELWQDAPHADAVLFQNDYRNRYFVKRDAFVLTGTDTAACWDALQLDAAFLIFRNTAAVRQLVQTWLDLCTDPRLLTDQPNVCGQPNLPGFVGHRHDQALLSLLTWKKAGGLTIALNRRSRKHRYLVHHRRRSLAVPIWLWHLFHDGFEALVRRVWDYDFGRGRLKGRE